MKLLFCPECGDIFSLDLVTKSCKCGKVSGRYLNTLDAEYKGGVPIGIHNKEFRNAIVQQAIIDKHNLDLFYGERFSAWVVPVNSNTFKEVKE